MSLATSIVLCTYNGARYLPAQWASVLAQSQLPDEIVVRDDASTDATPELLTRLAAEAEARGVAVRRLHGDCNLGYLANFEVALQAASGEVLLLCDQDDVWDPQKLAIQVAEFARRPELLLLCGNARRVDADGRDLHRSLFEVLRVTPEELRRIHAGQGFNVLLRRSMATGATVALRRSLLAEALPFPTGWVHDEWLAIIAAALGGFDCLESRLVGYRQHGENQIGMPERGLAAQWRDLVKPRAALIGMLIARDRILRARLLAMGDRVPVMDRHRTDEKLRHLCARQTLRGKHWSRIGIVLQEWLGGRYRRYGTGWRSAMRDLVRRG
jgi:hypothetical protein